MQPIKSLLVLGLLLLAMTTVGVSQQSIQVDDAFKEGRLENRLWHWADSTHKLTVNQILAIRQAGKGTLLTNSVPNLGDGNESHWVIFEVQNKGKATQNLVLEMYSSKLDTIEFFVFSGYTLIRATSAFSWQTPIANRDLPYRAFTYSLTLPINQTQTVVLRIVNTNGVLSIPIRLHQQKQFTLYIGNEELMHGLATGVMLLAFLLGLSLFLLSGKWLYFFYAGHIVGLALLLLAEEHYLNQYILPYSKLIAGPSAWAIGATISIFNHNFFSLLFLKINLKKQGIWVCIGGIINISALFIGLWLTVGFTLTDTLSEFVLYLCFAYVAFAAALLLYSLYNRIPEAYLYAIAISPFWALVLLTILNVLNIVPWLWSVKELVDFAPVFEIAILCIGLAYTFQRDQREKVKSLLVISNLREKVVSVRTDAQGAERRRVAADLHDNLGGMMSAIRLSIEAMDTSELSPKEKAVYENVLTMTRQAYNDVRLLAHNLQPEELEKFGLPEALQRLMNKLNDSQTIRFSLTMNTLGRLNKEIEFTLYSICLEMANNIVKHSQATEASFEFVDGGQHFQLLVADNGKGFIQNNTSAGMGMKNIQERTEQMEGTLEIHSRPGEGTLVRFMIPLRSSTHV